MASNNTSSLGITYLPGTVATWSELPVAQNILTCVLLLLLTTVAAWRRLFSPLRNIPGPFWASITRFWYFKKIIDGDQNVQLQQLHEKHGKFVRLAPNEVSITHPDAVKKLLLTPLQKGTFYGISRIPDWRFQTPMSTRDPKEKIERSKAFASGYAQSNILQYEDAVTHTIEKLLGWMDTYAATGAADETNSRAKPMELDKFISFTTFDVVGELLFSKPFGFLDTGEDLGNTVANNVLLERIGIPISQFGWMQALLLNPLVTALGLSPQSLVTRMASENLQARRRNPDARFDMVAHWLRYLAQHPDRTCFRNVEAQTAANIGAGSDTVSCAVQSTLYHMIRHPATWAQARREITAARRREGLCRGSVVSYADAQQLPYVQACIKESLRFQAPVPMALPRIAPKGGLEIGGIIFPEGTTLGINPWVFHRDKDIWGQDANEFKPERWLGEDAARLDRYLIPFGAGYMTCPGQHIARMELSKICSTIIRDYDLKLADPMKPWKFGAFFIMCPYDWPVLVSKTKPSQ